MFDLFVAVQAVKMSRRYMNQMAFLMIFEVNVFFILQMAGQTPHLRNDPAALGNLTVTVDARDVSVASHKILMTEWLIHKGHRLLGHGVTRQAVAGGHLFFTPAIEVARQTGGLGDADMLTLNGLPMTADAVQRFSIRMLVQMSVVTELDLVVEHYERVVFADICMTATLLTGGAADLTMGLGTVGAGNILHQLNHSLGLGCNSSGHARLGMAIDACYVFVR